MHLFFQSIGLIQQTALKIIILPFLCNYSTYSIKPLEHQAHTYTYEKDDHLDIFYIPSLAESSEQLFIRENKGR